MPTNTIRAPSKPNTNGAVTRGRPPRIGEAPSEITMKPPSMGSRLNIA